MGTFMSAEKKEMMNKIAHVFYKVFFKFQKRGMFSRSA
jgi:hypothetical protein